MSYKGLLVYVEDPQCGGHALETARAIVAHFGAHLTGLYVEKMTGYEPPYTQYELAEHGGVMNRSVQAPDENTMVRSAQSAFEQACRTRDLTAAEWCVVKGEPLTALALHARYNDAIVMAQPTKHHSSDARGADPDLPAKVAMASSRPVISVPSSDRFETLGQRILVAWNASPQATRAVTAALPFLRDADRVDIMVINPDTDEEAHGPEPGSDIALYLTRHGVDVEVIRLDSDADDVTDTLLSGAEKMNADLICMGAYGHSRLRELVLGGVTRRLMRDTRVPVLLTH